MRDRFSNIDEQLDKIVQLLRRWEEESHEMNWEAIYREIVVP